MNGRVQDAITGRFLSPDPTIPDPGFTQSFNRYSYVNDNPLSFVDPSGFCSDKPGDYAYCEVLDELQVRGECDIWCWIERMHYSLCIHLDATVQVSMMMEALHNLICNRSRLLLVT